MVKQKLNNLFKKLVRKIGKFLIYCLNEAEYEKVIETKIDSPNKLMNEWLFGGDNNDE